MRDTPMDRRRPRRHAPVLAGGGAGGPYWRLALLALLSLVCVTSAVAQAPAPVNDRVILAERPPELLSAYRFFRDAGARDPNVRVTAYDLNTPLWSDGALKFRYVYIPAGAQAQYNDERVFDFPVGTVLIKTFAFATDMRRPNENVRFLETRLLIRRAEGWVALPYVWNEEQTEARLSPIGANIPVSFINDAGETTALDWAVPNRNQCKGCHDRAGEFIPIGPTARNLNLVNEVIITTNRGSGSIQEINQLEAWSRDILLSGTPQNIAEAPRAPRAYDASDGTLEARARAYLDVNCAHCHNPEGPAHTSGLDLRWSQHEPISWGVNKRPVAAGRGSANMQFAIAPGDPDHSFLLYRMQSTDPGVMMPELGRQTVDPRAIALMREWISTMDASGRSPQ